MVLGVCRKLGCSPLAPRKQAANQVPADFGKALFVVSQTFDHVRRQIRQVPGRADMTIDSRWKNSFPTQFCPLPPAERAGHLLRVDVVTVLLQNVSSAGRPGTPRNACST